jgi:heme exporter protein A
MEVKDVYVSLDGSPILKSINFSWNERETSAIIGANGAGKTTLLKLICLLLKPVRGEVLLPGLKEESWRRKLGIVFPESFLYEDLTAYENLQFYQKLYGTKGDKRIIHMLKAVQLEAVKDKAVSTFSKGMKQRLSIARALIHDPEFLILDEPFDGLDLQSKQILEDLLLERKNKGISWLLVSHDVEHAWSLCDEALLMDQGEIVAQERCQQKAFDDFIQHYSSLLKGVSQ